MTRQQFEEQVLRLIGKSDPQFKVDGREVIALAHQAAMEIVSIYRKNSVPIPSSMYVPYIKTIVKGEVLLPLALIGKESIESVIKEGVLIPIVINESEARIYDVIGNDPSCWAVQGKVKFRNVLDGAVVINGIPNLLEIDDDDLMYGEEVQLEIISRIFNMLQIKLQQPEDRENNG